MAVTSVTTMPTSVTMFMSGVPHVMISDDTSNRAGDAFGHRYMQKLIGPMRIGVGPQNARHHELRAGEFLAQHCHERDAAAFADKARGRTERGLRSIFDSVREPRLERRGIPAAHAALCFELDLGAIRRRCFENSLDGGHGLLAIDIGRQANRNRAFV